MEEAKMAIDVPEMAARKSVKRRRVESALSPEERETRIAALRQELDGLFKFYHHFREQKYSVFSGPDLGVLTGDSLIAFLLEESNLPLSRLVDEIYDKVKKEGLTCAAAKKSVLQFGVRSCYGVPNPDADVLEDETPSCLWCWETRDSDIKLIPMTIGIKFKVRRTCRGKIRERIIAVSDVITELMNSSNTTTSSQGIMKASKRLRKVLNEADIRLLIESMGQENGVDVANKEVKLEGKKLLMKQLERDTREMEKQKKRMERELQKDRLQTEKEMKRAQEEADKEEKRREKEESEMKKQIRRQQEETEKDQRRREKDEAELKKQLALQKQASLLERFLKKSKENSPSQSDISSTKSSALDKSPDKVVKVPESVTQSMDCALSLRDGFNINDLWKLHMTSWHLLGPSVHRKQHWGIRQRPKTEVVKELKLTNRGAPSDDDPSLEKVVDRWSEEKIDCRPFSSDVDKPFASSKKVRRRKQLLQFDKSHRPAFYGSWPKESQVVGGRRPFVRDPDLDYEIDSDEEWEEEEPGESLSDCDKEEDDESMDEGAQKANDEDESEDGFFVPDGYLSENEGVEVDRMDCDDMVEEARNSPSSKHKEESEELHLLFRQQKHLHKLTENALRKNQPLVILNFVHGKTQSFSAQDSTVTTELEQMCLQALSIRVFPVGQPIEISVGSNVQEENHEDSPLLSKDITMSAPVASTSAIQDSDLPEIVQVIRSCPHGINKLVESLHQKFQTVSKAQLRNKVREISNFADNRWQVKKEILNKLGLTPSHDKSSKTKTIAAFFSKRCFPPLGKTIDPNVNEISPQSLNKSLSAVEQQKHSNALNSQ